MKTIILLETTVHGYHNYGGTYNISIDWERGLAVILGQVDPNALLYALAQSGQHTQSLFTSSFDIQPPDHLQ